MAKKKSKLQIAREKAEKTIEATNEKINALGNATKPFYDLLDEIQTLFDNIRAVPHEQQVKLQELKDVRLNWMQQVEKIESDFNEAMAKGAGKGAAGVAFGVSVAALGPAAAMGVATTFGVASTGTAISALHGVAAYNAALAWLGGGALAAGGGGMAAGEAFLAAFGPVGWVIGGAALLASTLLLWKAGKEKKRLEEIYTLISKRDTKSYQLAIVELNERITRIKEESILLAKAIGTIRTYGLEYDKMTEEQQYQLGSYVNLMESSTRLLVNPIMGLQAKYSKEDLFKEGSSNHFPLPYVFHITYVDVMVYLCNLLYKIPLGYEDRKLLSKSFRKNKQFLKAMGIQKNFMTEEIMETVALCLCDKYKNESE